MPGLSDRRDKYRNDDRRSDIRRDERRVTRSERRDTREWTDRKDQGENRDLGRRDDRDNRERRDNSQIRRRDDRSVEWRRNSERGPDRMDNNNRREEQSLAPPAPSSSSSSSRRQASPERAAWERGEEKEEEERELRHGEKRRRAAADADVPVPASHSDRRGYQRSGSHQRAERREDAKEQREISLERRPAHRSSYEEEPYYHRRADRRDERETGRRERESRRTETGATNRSETETDRRSRREPSRSETEPRRTESETNRTERDNVRRTERTANDSEEKSMRDGGRDHGRSEREWTRRPERDLRPSERVPVGGPERDLNRSERERDRRSERDAAPSERGSFRRTEREPRPSETEWTGRTEKEPNQSEREPRRGSKEYRRDGLERDVDRPGRWENHEYRKREREASVEETKKVNCREDTVRKETSPEEEEERQIKKRKMEEEEAEAEVAVVVDAEVVTDAEVRKELQLSSFRISQGTIDCLAKRGITSLFEIQAATFDAIYDGEDVLARARTGTGKTLAFSLPVIEKLSLEKASSDVYGRAPRVLVLCPTRDLAKQVCGDFESISGNRLKSLAVYGGVPYPEQTNVLRSGVDVIVGTPGRVLDHIKGGQLRLGNLRYIILDEADEMLDARGFEEDMFRVLEFVKEQKTSRDYQMLLFSATVPESVMETIKRFVKQDYRRIDLIGDAKNRTNQNIRHIAMPSSITARASVIGDVVNVYGKRGLTVIFCATKADANELSTHERIKQDAAVLHGDIAQQSREATMKAFREGKYRCIVCTDVLARGLDIPQVDLVINCQPPKDTESYVHRSGRTGRAGRSGVCVTFYKPNEEGILQTISRRTGVQFETMSAPRAEDVIKATTEDAFRSIDLVKPEVLPFFLDSARQLIEKHGAEEAVASALAFMTGYHQGVPSRSLLSSMEGHTTLYFKLAYTVQSPGYVRSMLVNAFPTLDPADCTSWRLTRDRMGVVVDIVSDKIENKENVIYLAGVAWMDKPEITLEIPDQLPALAEHPRAYGGGGGGGGGYGHRNNGYGGGGGGNGRYGNNRSSSSFYQRNTNGRR
ncbi:hypothetical protein EC973_003021 [Apophysomyces ossiformis]|uniref:RNA helicase n=1 Tax=Apophysomyces ossiformis TaxID=679940 RepID=A0A8H7BZZ1_9FUNG|nr:hypothetical protein EC973_003021 [Apophysomyces ossiformis]